MRISAIFRRTFKCRIWSAQLGDFGDLAVIIDQLDLVISVDSPVAHMAGALGKKAWTLLSHRSGLALDVRGRDHAVVSDDAPVSPDTAG